jgi:antitoxin CptB
VNPDERTLRFRCRRGMRELDLVLMRYLERHYATSSANEQDAFVALLNREDPVLYAWLLGEEPPGAALQAVVRQLRAFR